MLDGTIGVGTIGVGMLDGTGGTQVMAFGIHFLSITISGTIPIGTATTFHTEAEMLHI